MLRRIVVLLFGFLLIASISLGEAPRRTENVVFVVWDGFRWEEFFAGADAALIDSKTAGGQRDPDALKERSWRDSAEKRRETLLPFVWGTVAKQGQIFGDPSRNARARLTNGMKFSYPGYNEMFCGFGDPRIDSNDKKNNPNLSVLEFLNGRPAFKGKVAAICTWDVFPYIFRVSESKLPVFSGWNHLQDQPLGERQLRVNEMVDNLPHYWTDNTFDLLTIESSRDYLRKHTPRMLFIGLGETDEWAHARRYDLYLNAARNGDRHLAELWSTFQKLPQYKDKTTMIVTCDHGREATPVNWTDHGEKVAGAEFVWIAIMGPDTPAKGVRENVEVTLSQLAATVSGLLGEDFQAANPRIAGPLPDVGCPAN